MTAKLKGPFNTLDDWLAWLETLSPREIDLGLERVLEVLGRLELRKPATVIHVAGTNGKGSCAAMLEALLRGAGARTGCYTSPHLLRYNERIRLNGVPADDAGIISALETVESVREGLPLTYFEFGTLAALVVFERNGADTLVLEIGMGGRLDAVNAVEPDVGIITNVDRDHCEWLGNDAETIAGEKAGIMRAGKPVVFGSEVIPAAITASAARIGADLRILGRDFWYTRDPARPEKWNWRGRKVILDGIAVPSLAGRFQLQNASAVLASLEAIDRGDALAPDRVSKALQSLALPGRFQWLERKRRWLLDVAHNPHAAAGLATSLAALEPRPPVTAIIGVLADKEVRGIVTPLLPHVARWIAVTAHNSRALPARELAQSVSHLADKPCLVADDLSQAMSFAESQADVDEVILVTGSFYTVGPALEALQ
ncbi:MAG TPA: folylpolyglutamate synthase/dihydrofolate synthase family protein [Woeseiaceae bacterium]|nr:folylpolyglutamate synthase/dihydrofolate synthase family protein [Woeseiaceae bacterium]